MAQEIKFLELANFQDKQLTAWYALFDEKTKYLLFGGAMSGGKSYLLRWSAVGLALYYTKKYGIKNCPIGLFSEDYPTLKDRQISRIAKEFPDWLGELKETKSDGFAYVLKDRFGGGRIMLRNLDDPSKYKSTEFVAILVEELTRNVEDTFQDLRTRLRYPKVDEVKFLGVTNPGGIGHGWVKKFWIDRNSNDKEQDRFVFIPATVYDNKYIDATYIEQLKALPEKKRKAYLEGSWSVFEGQFFSEFSTLRHVISPFVPKKPCVIIGGMDWGTTAPFSFHLSVLKNEKTQEGIAFHRVITFFEVYGTERTPYEWSEIINTKLLGYNLAPCDVVWIQGDPSMFTRLADTSISIADQFAKEKIMIKKGSNDRIGGWVNMHNWLRDAPDGLPYWLITENCVNLIKEIPELVYDENSVEDVDSAGIDHASDANRYMLKALKWIDASAGFVHHQPAKPKFQTFTPSIDIQKFGKPTKKRLFNRRVRMY